MFIIILISALKFGLEKNLQIFGSLWQRAIYAGRRKLIFSPTSSAFWPFLWAPAEKLMPHSQVIFKSWSYNEESKLYPYISE